MLQLQAGVHQVVNPCSCWPPDMPKQLMKLDWSRNCDRLSTILHKVEGAGVRPLQLMLGVLLSVCMEIPTK